MSYRILILDRNYQTSVTLQHILKETFNLNSKIVNVSKEKELYSLFEKLKKNDELPDFLFLSDNFPNMKFSRMVDIIKEIDKYSVIIGCLSFPKNQKGMEDKVFDILYKPFNRKEIKKILEKLTQKQIDI